MDNTKYDLIIFDMDGLMIDTEAMCLAVFEKIIKNYPYKFDLEFFKTLIGIPDLEMEPIIKDFYDKDFPFHEFLKESFTLRDEIIDGGGVELKKGLLSLLEHLDKKGIKKAVATSNIRPTTEKILSMKNILKYFDYLVCSDEIEKGKPHPDVFLKAIEKANVDPQKALIFEDSANGIKAAHAANIPCIFIKDIVQPTSDVMKLIYKQLDDLSQAIDLI